jgi:hypothetical protein
MIGTSDKGQAIPTTQARANPRRVPSKNNHINSARGNNIYASILDGTPFAYISALNSMNAANVLMHQ